MPHCWFSISNKNKPVVQLLCVKLHNNNVYNVDLSRLIDQGMVTGANAEVSS